MAGTRDECERCGSYAVLTLLGGHSICDDCAERLRPIERTPATLFNVLAGSVVVLGRAWMPALVLAIAGALPAYLFRRFVIDVPWILEWAFGVLVQGAMLEVAQRAIRERPIDLERCVRGAFDAWGRLALVSFLAYLQLVGIALVPAIVTVVIAMMIGDTTIGIVATWIGLLVALGLVMWRGALLAVALPISLHEDPPGSALSASTARMKKRLPAALAFALCGLAVTIVPSLGWIAMTAMEVGYLVSHGPFVAPPEELAQMGDALEIGGELAASALTIVMTTISAVLYAKTMKYRIH